jgi:hypothetical protein
MVTALVSRIPLVQAAAAARSTAGEEVASVASATAASFAPDREHSTTYIICEHDQALPPAAAGSA